MDRMTTRRRFFKAVALGGVSSAASASPADEPERPTDTPGRLLADVVRLRFGRHLSEAQVKAAQERINRNLASAELLKRTRLENGDEPAFVFLPGD